MPSKFDPTVYSFYKNLNDVVLDGLTQAQPSLVNLEDALGIRACVPLTVGNDTKQFYLEFFAQIVMPDHPLSELGYDMSDGKLSTGVQLCILGEDRPKGDIKPYRGQVYPVNDFIHAYVVVPELRDQIFVKIAELEEFVWQQKNFADEANTRWLNRNPGTTKIIEQRYLC